MCGCQISKCVHKQMCFFIFVKFTQERDELLTTMAAVEKERDFYFDKLRDIELLFQARENRGRTTNPPVDAVVRWFFRTYMSIAHYLPLLFSGTGSRSRSTDSSCMEEYVLLCM